MKWVAMIAVVSGCSFGASFAGSDFTPPRCGQWMPITDGILTAMSLGGCIAISATRPSNELVSRSVVCVPLGALAVTYAISALYGVTKRDACRRAAAT